MATNKQISELPEAAELTGEELLVAQQDGAAVQVPLILLAMLALEKAETAVLGIAKVGVMVLGTK